MSRVVHHRAAQDVAHIGHVELLTPRLQDSLEFFTGALGMQLEAELGRAVYLRGRGGHWPFSLKLSEASAPGIGHVGIQASSPIALARRVRALERSGLGQGWIDREGGHRPAYQFNDPGLHTMELYLETKQPACERSIARVAEAPPGPGVRGFDHVTLRTRDVGANRRFAQDLLGYCLRERTADGGEPERDTWLVAAQELAYDYDRDAPHGELDHLAFSVDASQQVLEIADLFLSHGVRLEVPPSRHPAPPGLFVRVQEPGGNRIEVTWGGYQINGPHFEPVVWDHAERQYAVADGLR